MASDFATNPTTMATYDDVSYAAVITDYVMDSLMAQVVTPQLMNVFDISSEATKAVKIPKADKFTASAVAEGVELANTPLTSDSVTLTTAEIGIQATITDVLELSDIAAAHGARLRQLGKAMADKIDIDICALLSGFSTGVGSTGVDMSLNNILDAIYALEVADAASLGSLVFMGHTRQVADIRSALVTARPAYTHLTAGDYSVPAETNIGMSLDQTGQLGKASAGYFGSWFGIDFYQSTNVPTANAGADRAGAVFVRNHALGMPQKYRTRVEPMRWAPIRGWVLVSSAMYGVGEIEDAAGVKVVTDA